MSCASNEKRIFIGIDTSCYTSSAACVCVDGILADKRRLLAVGLGERGLRQSDAVFQHTKNMTEILPQMLESLDKDRVAGIGVSVCPSGRKDSYMPVFLVGKMLAETLGAALKVPVFGFTHQQGHIRAALVGNEHLMGMPFFAFHLSGGTSEVLAVDDSLGVERIGGTTDISAGQLVDRIGVKLGLGFPAGKQLEALAKSAGQRGVVIPSSVSGCNFSFSGAETKAARAIDSGEEREQTAFSIYDLIARTLDKVMKNIREENKSAANDAPFLFSGGVASSALLTKLLLERTEGSGVRLLFAKSTLASDNAVGAALLCMDRLLKSN